MSGGPTEARPIVTSVENETRDRCIDFLEHPDGTFTYREYRRDAEDSGRWTLLGDYPHPRHQTRAEAERHAASNISWLPDRQTPPKVPPRRNTQ